MESKKKKPIYKRVWFIILAVILGLFVLVLLFGEDVDEPEESTPEIETEETEAPDDETEATEEEPADENEEEPEEMDKETQDEYNKIEIKADVSRYAKDYNRTTVKDVKVNKDWGTGEGYIVLAYFSFDAMNRPNTAKSMIDMYSQDLGARLADNENVNEVTVFWEVPYLHEGSNIAKYNMQRHGDGMAIMEKWFDPRVFD